MIYYSDALDNPDRGDVVFIYNCYSGPQVAVLICDTLSGDVTGVTCNDVRAAAGRHALGGSQIKRVLNQFSIMFKLESKGYATRNDIVNDFIINDRF